MLPLDIVNACAYSLGMNTTAAPDMTKSTLAARIRIHEATIQWSKDPKRIAEAKRLLEIDRAHLARL